MSTATAMVTSWSICPMKKKWLKFHDGQYQFKVPFMLYADFENILKPVDGWYRDKMNTMKAERTKARHHIRKR